MTDALRAEWTKLRTSPGTAWILLATVALTAGLSTLVAGTIHVSGRSGEDPTKISLIGVDLGQAILAVLGVLAAWSVGALLIGGCTLQVRNS